MLSMAPISNLNEILISKFELSSCSRWTRIIITDRCLVFVVAYDKLNDLFVPTTIEMILIYCWVSINQHLDRNLNFTFQFELQIWMYRWWNWKQMNKIIKLMPRESCLDIVRNFEVNSPRVWSMFGAELIISIGRFEF